MRKITGVLFMLFGSSLLVANRLLGDDWLPSSLLHSAGLSWPTAFVGSGVILFSFIGIMGVMIVRELHNKR